MKLKLYAVGYRAHACFHLNNFWNILQHKTNQKIYQRKKEFSQLQ